ncbi:hypothetical protein KFE25_006846 [Diacronema lutheri]|uniref:Uncharacterized protein n=2 Tax=Diacronema lutheri TaxID=2081491 RepID=A0A8J5XWI7_DIALT|nr:hypothetical protein KFE25_006846 [Diacronema lutheri]
MAARFLLATVFLVAFGRGASPGPSAAVRSPLLPRTPGVGQRGRGRASPCATAGERPPSAVERARTFVGQNTFPIGMALAVAAARVAPALGANGGPLRLDITVGRLGVAAIFFLSGLGIRTSELAQAATSVRLNAFVQLVTFALWPGMTWLLVQLVRAMHAPLSSALLDGLLVTSCLPTTVNMCVIMTQAAGGNVALAITNAVFSNTAGVFVTPLLLLGLMGRTIDVSLADVCAKLARTVVLPVLLGQLARSAPPVQAFAARRARASKKVSEAVLLLIIYNTFSEAFLSKGAALSGADLLALGVTLPIAYAGALLGGARLLARTPIAPGDAVAVLFCTSQKTLAFGLPLIRLVFAGNADLAFFTAPIMILHPLQLLAGSVLQPAVRKALRLDGRAV